MIISVCEKLGEDIKLFLRNENLGIPLAVRLFKKFKEAKGDWSEVTDVQKEYIQQCLNNLVFRIKAGGLSPHGNYCEVMVHC